MDHILIKNAHSPVMFAFVEESWTESFKNWKCNAPLLFDVIIYTMFVNTVVLKNVIRTCQFICHQHSGLFDIHFSFGFNVKSISYMMFQLITTVFLLHKCWKFIIFNYLILTFWQTITQMNEKLFEFLLNCYLLSCLQRCRDWWYCNYWRMPTNFKNSSFQRSQNHKRRWI